MEQNYIDKQVKNQIQLIVRETNSEVNHSAFRFQSKLKLSSIFIIPNKGKGPPGRMRSPGYFPEHPPDEVATPDSVSNPVGGKGHIINSIQFFKTINSNFLTQLNFTIMKKQIFILVMALFAVNVAWGQSAVHHEDPRPLTCTDDALHPIAGKPYGYTVDVTANPGGEYQWWATQQNSFIQNGAPNLTGALTVTTSELLYTSPGYGASGAYSTQTITWSSEILAATVSGTTPTFVSVMYDGATGICANNFKAYQIDPRNGFTVDIYPIDGTTSTTLTTVGATASSCVGDVASVTWSGSQMLYDYGTATATFEVVAANFSGAFTPSFNVVLNAAQTAIVQWAYDPDFTQGLWTASAATAAGGGVVTSTQSATTTVSDTSQGVSIYVRLIISNNTFENLTADNHRLTLAVDAVNSVGQSDVVNDDCATITSFEDIANYDLLPRPTLVGNTPTGGFVPENSTH